MIDCGPDLPRVDMSGRQLIHLSWNINLVMFDFRYLEICVSQPGIATYTEH